MRDPKRIPIICDLLREAWECSPDERLGQFISNLLGPGVHDVFFLEDDEWQRLLRDYIINHVEGDK